MANLLSTMPETTLAPGMIIRFEAIDVDTEAAVAGVVVSEAAVQAIDEATGQAVVLTQDTPLWLPIPVDAQAP